MTTVLTRSTFIIFLTRFELTKVKLGMRKISNIVKEIDSFGGN